MSTAIAKLRSQLFYAIDRNFNLCLVLLYSILGLLGILNHAMWRDEINVWLITRDSPDVSTLIQNVRYEGHPIIWYLCLFALNQITANPVAMQLFHWLLGVAIATIFVVYAPFARWQKALLVFGYYSIYEYFLISRNYSIGLLFLFLFCAFFRYRRISYLPSALLLLLLANTNAFALFLSFSLGVMLLAEYGVDAQLRNTHSRWDALGGLAVWLLGLYLSLVLLIPPSDANLAGGWELHMHLEWSRLFQVLSIIWRAHIPVLRPADRDTFPFAIISIGLWIWIVSRWSRKPLLILLYSVGSLLILSFCYFKFIGVERHHGYLFLLTITCLWLAHEYPESFGADNSFPSRWGKQAVLAKLGRWMKRHHPHLIRVILVTHCVAGLVAVGRDFVLPYSASRATAQYIQAQNLTDHFIVGSRDFAVSPLCGYLNRQIYYPEIQAMGSFVLFRQARQEVDLDQILTQVTTLSQTHPDILLILSPEITKDKTASTQTLSAHFQHYPQLQIEPLRDFTHGLIWNEKYMLYRVQPVPPVAP